MNFPSNLKYSKSDEWFDPASGKMGLTDYAQDQLSDIVFVESLVEVDDSVEAGGAIASVESVKASAETYATASGTVTAVNEALADAPETPRTLESPVIASHCRCPSHLIILRRLPVPVHDWPPFVPRAVVTRRGERARKDKEVK